jgi:hypothetical protein
LAPIREWGGPAREHHDGPITVLTGYARDDLE